MSDLHKYKYLNQANFFTRSLFKLKKEIHKDIVYLVQSKIDFFGEPKETVQITFEDYLNYKGLKRNDTYSFDEFYNFVGEITAISGAFYNKVNQQFISFNVVDNVKIDKDNPECLNIDLAKFGKVFFFKKELERYIKSVTPKGKPLKYIGHTQIESTVFSVKGARRKKFFEIISQFKNTGFCKISFQELKMYLGYIEIVDKDTKKPLNENEQLKMIFLPEDKYEFIDSCPRYSIFERDFLKPAIEAINKDKGKDINNLMISKKLKTGRRITHLEFTFNSLGKELTEEESKCLEFFKDLGLEEQQILYLLKRIGYKEMYGRYMRHINRRVDENQNSIFVQRKNGVEIENLGGYFYTVLFPELKKD